MSWFKRKFKGEVTTEDGKKLKVEGTIEGNDKPGQTPVRQDGFDESELRKVEEKMKSL